MHQLQNLPLAEHKISVSVFIAVAANTVDFQDVLHFRKPFFAGFGFEFFSDALIDSLHFMAFGAEEVMVMIIRGCQFIEVTTAIQGDALHDSDPLKRFECAIDGDEITLGQFCLIT